jgi:hypothetical protein
MFFQGIFLNANYFTKNKNVCVTSPRLQAHPSKDVNHLSTPKFLKRFFRRVDGERRPPTYPHGGGGEGKKWAKTVKLAFS